MEGRSSGSPFRLHSIILRIGTIVSCIDITPCASESLLFLQVLSLILIAISAATFGTIYNNLYLKTVLLSDGVELLSAFKDLQDLMTRSLAAAGFIMLLGVIVLIAEITAIVLVAIFKSLHLAILIVVSGTFLNYCT